jgi:hypothetical protein
VLQSSLSAQPAAKFRYLHFEVCVDGTCRRGFSTAFVDKRVVGISEFRREFCPSHRIESVCASLAHPPDPETRAAAAIRSASTYATRLSAGGVADEWKTQVLRQGDAKVFKKYWQMKPQFGEVI